MRTLSRRDVLASLVTGLTTGTIATGILLYLGHALPAGVNPLLLIPVVPVVWLAGIQLGYTLSKALPAMAQFGRFCAIGFSNAMVDFGVLYLLIAQTGYATGAQYTLFKALSFTAATIHSYFWNKYWAFDAGNSHGGTREVTSFVSVSLVALLVNVTIASLVVTLRPDAIDAKTWAGIGAVVGSASALILSFVGFRLFVFRMK